jgi:hypothetical protein
MKNQFLEIEFCTFHGVRFIQPKLVSIWNVQALSKVLGNSSNQTDKKKNPVPLEDFTFHWRSATILSNTSESNKCHSEKQIRDEVGVGAG